MRPSRPVYRSSCRIERDERVREWQHDRGLPAAHNGCAGDMALHQPARRVRPTGPSHVAVAQVESGEHLARGHVEATHHGAPYHSCGQARLDARELAHPAAVQWYESAHQNFVAHDRRRGVADVQEARVRPTPEHTQCRDAQCANSVELERGNERVAPRCWRRHDCSPRQREFAHQLAGAQLASPEHAGGRDVQDGRVPNDRRGHHRAFVEASPKRPARRQFVGSYSTRRASGERRPAIAESDNDNPPICHWILVDPIRHARGPPSAPGVQVQRLERPGAVRAHQNELVRRAD